MSISPARRAVLTALALGVARLGAAQPSQGASAAESAAQAKLASIRWTTGPATGNIGTVARLRVPATCRYAEAAGARAFLEATQNLPSGDELGVLDCEGRGAEPSSWFVIYTYDASGYVRDDEKGALDADAILASIRRGTQAANEERRARGWEEMVVDGWVRPPHYDERTNNLTWSLTGHSTGGTKSVNHSVRLLGRGGVLKAELVIDPGDLAAGVADFDGVMASTAFVTGQRYAEWREGDKVAEYGLTALVAGGIGAAAVKTGLIGKLGKLAVLGWKLLVGAFVVVGGAIKSLFSRKREPQAAPR